MADKKIINEILREETKKRLVIMADPTYQFPEPISVMDRSVILVGIIGSLLLLVACMMGWLGE